MKTSEIINFNNRTGLKNTAVAAAVLVALGSVTGCVRSSVSSATGGSVTVVDNGNSQPQVTCTPGTSNGPNAQAGSGTAVVNGQIYQCPAGQ